MNDEHVKASSVLIVLNIILAIILAMIEFYQATVGLIFGGACRFEPSCSAYAKQAFLQHGLIEGLRVSMIRLIKCRPGGPWGFDPVPSVSRRHQVCVSTPASDQRAQKLKKGTQ